MASKMNSGFMAMMDKKKDGMHMMPDGKMMKDSAMKKGGMAEGGMMDKKQDKAMIIKAFKQHDAQEHKGGKGTTLKLAKGGSASARADGCAERGKTKGTMVFCGGGMTKKMSMGGSAC